MNSIFVFSSTGNIIAENLSTVQEALAFIKYNAADIINDSDINATYVIVDFENGQSQFVKLQFEVVPA